MQPKSVAEYANEFGQIQNNALARKQAQMQIDAATKAAEQEVAYNQLAKGFGTDIQSNVNALRQGGLGTRADTYLKSAQEAQEKAAKTSKDMAETDATKYKLQRSKYENGISVLVGSQTPEDAIARINKGVTDGAWSMQEAQQKISEIPSDPTQFQDWRRRELLGVVSAKDQLDNILKQQEFGLKANNELIGPDGKINQTLLGAKKQVAQAGAPVQSSVTYQVDGQGNLVALPTKIPSGSGSVSSVPVMSGGQPVQGVGKDKPLPEAAQKQVMGARNLQDAVGGYLAKLQGWSNAKMLSPDDRADMGNAYNNMMLQAKEAYNLGVLNGPDYDILQSVVKDPTKLTSVLTSNEALGKQAESLRSIAANIEKTAMEAHGKKYTPREQNASADTKPAPANLPKSNSKGWTLHVDAKGNRAYVSPDGKRFEEVK